MYKLCVMVCSLQEKVKLVFCFVAMLWHLFLNEWAALTHWMVNTIRWHRSGGWCQRSLSQNPPPPGAQSNPPSEYSLLSHKCSVPWAHPFQSQLEPQALIMCLKKKQHRNSCVRGPACRLGAGCMDWAATVAQYRGALIICVVKQFFVFFGDMDLLNAK